MNRALYAHQYHVLAYGDCRYCEADEDFMDRAVTIAACLMDPHDPVVQGLVRRFAYATRNLDWTIKESKEV